MKSTYTGRKAIRRDGHYHFAEVTICATSCSGSSEVVLLPAALDHLHEVFGPDFEYYKHCVWNAVHLQISIANVAGEMPFVEASSFRVEVIEVKISGDAGREVSDFLLTIAGMNAVGDFLQDWERQEEAANPVPPEAIRGAVSIDGYAPPLAGLRCDAILCQELWEAGTRTNPANLIHLCFEGRWHCFHFRHEINSLLLRYGIIFWKSGGAYAGKPSSSDIPELAGSFPIVDVATQRGLVGVRLLGYVMESVEDGVMVTFDFEGGRRLVFRLIDDATTYHDA